MIKVQISIDCSRKTLYLRSTNKLKRMQSVLEYTQWFMMAQSALLCNIMLIFHRDRNGHVPIKVFSWTSFTVLVFSVTTPFRERVLFPSSGGEVQGRCFKIRRSLYKSPNRFGIFSYAVRRQQSTLSRCTGFYANN